MIDWDDAFDNTGYVEGAKELGAIWAAEAASYRDRLSEAGRAKFDIEYGSSDRQKLDIFMPEETPKGLCVFVHGGYWHLFDKSYWSHLAQGCVDAGYAMALPSYTLAPFAKISEMTKEIAKAIEIAGEHVAGPIRLSGHSAGGHLVSRMMCQDDVLDTASRDRLARVVSISGVHDLRPLVGIKMNETLGLSDAEAADESPALHKPHTIPFTAWVGADERPEFLRQNRLIAEKWARGGGNVHSHYDPSHNHFTVINALKSPNSPLVAEILR